MGPRPWKKNKIKYNYYYYYYYCYYYYYYIEVSNYDKLYMIMHLLIIWNKNYQQIQKAINFVFSAALLLDHISMFIS